MKSRARLFLFLLIALGIGGWYFWPKLQNTVTVQNQAGKTIRWILVSNGDDSQRLENVAASEGRRTKLDVGQDNLFTVQGEFADGKPLRETTDRFKIVGGDFGFQVVISVFADGSIQVVGQAPKGY
jgi:hypothetical protein